MDIFEAILTRRSIRKFKSAPLRELDLEKMLHAAMQAPSAHNAQPWHFIIISQREILNRIAAFHPYAGMLVESPAAIAVCGDLDKESSREYLSLNCSAATENILLAAHGSGLGAVWLGIYPRSERIEKLSKLLNLPRSILPISLVALGYPAEMKPAVNRYNKNLIHVNQW